MNAEVLAAARETAKRLHAAKTEKEKTSIADIFDAFLDHIDEQAKDIAHRDMLYRRKDAVCASLEQDVLKANHRYADLQQICDDQDEQIATLKAALLSDRAYICSANVIETQPMDSCFVAMAKKQLAQELPEIFGEME